MHEVTRILCAVEEGDLSNIDTLLPMVYDELRMLAAQKLAHERPGQTLQATALVHEAYLRLVGSDNGGWKSRAYFFGAAAEAMRRILVENARRRGQLKHGGDRVRGELRDDNVATDERSEDLMALDEALKEFAQTDAAKAELVKMRYFAGLTNQQVAELLNISPATAKRHWAFARAWLYRRIQSQD